jgi:hypothetical protein
VKLAGHNGDVLCHQPDGSWCFVINIREERTDRQP